MCIRDRYLLDEKGNKVKDSLGDAIKVDKLVTVSCHLVEFTQHKDVEIFGDVRYHNLRTNQMINSYPVSSTFIFEHRYANFTGDKRAIDDVYNDIIGLRPVPFPTNQQMIYDTGEDLKQRIKDIITQNKL